MRAEVQGPVLYCACFKCRPLPTRPSPYVGGVLQALRAFLDTDAGKRLEPSAQQELAQVRSSSGPSIPAVENVVEGTVWAASGGAVEVAVVTAKIQLDTAG